MQRRKFLELAALGLSGSFVFPKPASTSERNTPTPSPSPNPVADDYGSGHFGKWITDSSGMPAYQYTCNQITDPTAFLPLNKVWRSPTDHMHQVGNNRVVAVASNYGYIQVRQDEGNIVRVKVAIDRQELGDPHPGASVTGGVFCGRRALGYVWFHEAWEWLQTHVFFYLS